MSRNLKILGLAVVAMLAMSAVAASAASAKHHFNAPNAPTDGTGTQTTQNIFQTPAGEVKCNTATFSGTQGAVNANEVTVAPHYTNCTAFFFTAHVNMNGCTYKFTTPTGTVNSTQFTGEPPHIICPAGAQIQITVTVPFAHCTINVPAQTPTSGNVTYQNQGAGTTRDVLVTSGVTGIHSTGSGGVCGGASTNGSYTGSVTLKGYQDGNHAIHEPIQILAT
jgi:hypothetical protein